MNTKLNIDAMSLDEMWGLHESLIEVLSARLTSEKRELETKLAKLCQTTGCQDRKQMEMNEAGTAQIC